MSGPSVRVIGECRWRNEAMHPSIVDEIERYKLPALAQVKGITIDPDLRILLFSRGGFTDGLVAAAGNDLRIGLVALDDLITVPGDT